MCVNMEIYMYVYLQMAISSHLLCICRIFVVYTQLETKYFTATHSLPSLPWWSQEENGRKVKPMG